MHQPADPERSPVLLLVSDCPEDAGVRKGAHAASVLISAARCDVVVAHDGPQALRLLQGRDTRPPLRPAMILLDLRTRDMNGFDFMIHVRADPATRNLPVKMLATISARTSPEIVLSGQEPLHDRNAPRPRTSQELLRGLHALGATWLGDVFNAAEAKPEGNPARLPDQGVATSPDALLTAEGAA